MACYGIIPEFSFVYIYRERTQKSASVPLGKMSKSVKYRCQKLRPFMVFLSVLML
jgi:hypothetical protein